MQLLPTDKLVLISGAQPIRTKKARYYEDRRLQERILPPPSFVNLVKESPKAHRDDWSALAPVAVNPKPAADRPTENGPDNAGIRREPTLPEHKAIAPESPTTPDPFAMLVDEADDEPMKANTHWRAMRAVARQAALDPGDGLEL